MRRLLFSPEPGSGIPALLRAGVLAGGGSQTYSGSVVTFTAKRARAVKSLTAAIEPVQSGNGDPSPENVRPISGWDAVNVVRTGKNLLPYASGDTATENGITWVKNSDGSLTFSGTCTQSKAMSFVEFKLPAGSYLYSNVGSTFAYTGGNNRPYTYIRDLDHAKTLVEIGFSQISTGAPFTLAEETNIRFYAVFITDNVVSGILYPMIRLASVTDSAYAPYTGQTYPIALGRTVYGGSLDVTTGVLTVDRVLETLDGTETTYMRNTWGHYYTRNDLKQGRATDFYAISSQYTPGSHYWTVAGTGEILTNNTQYIIMDDRFNTVESWKAHLAEEYQNGTPVQVVYRLEEPQTYQLTPTEVDTLLGDNCIWADTGDIIVIV